MIAVTIDSQCYREQFDDWIASGHFEYATKTYHWFAENGNYGAGWNVEPPLNQDWDDIPEDQLPDIMAFLQRCLCQPQTEYVS